METIAKQTLVNEETLLLLIEDFFDCRKLPQHLLFLDYWMEKVLVNRKHKKYLKASDLSFFSDKFSKLLTVCNELLSDSSEEISYLEECIKIPENLISTEQNSISFYPTYLRKKEICNPILVFHSVFKKFPLDYYTYILQNLADESQSAHAKENVKHLILTFKNLKRLVEACWLIHERSISKNSNRLASSTNVTATDFSLSCPLLLTDEYLTNPYLFVESFFSFADINEYRQDITQWIKTAINEYQRYENPSDLLFIHNQLSQLLHAGYLIGASQLVYKPILNYSKQHDTFGHWLLARMEDQYSIQALSPHYAQNPLQYCIENLTFNHIVKLRVGLKEWLEAALSKSTSITSLDHSYIFDQFEELQRMLEALFLLIVQPALVD